MTHLTRLDIHGFKSFARPTSFVFNDGITAIIGPNGSGKSNVSEALRWVLGETRYSALRGRKTEDVIFAGSASHARLGMAEVTLTLDNSDGGLPIEFSEITVSRRADRSGDNQYLINGSRVLLREVQQLTASLGQAHTIIGQGLVDAVLSQRPEDRRGLFEHAAGITGLRLQADEAERGMNVAVENTQRLRDILAELEPRVRSLKRGAKQAQDYDDVRRELRTLQRNHYGSLWRESTEKQRQAGAELEQANSRLEEAEAQQHLSSSQLGQQRESERLLVERLTALQTDLANHERTLADAQHRIDLVKAEARASARRQQDLQSALDTLVQQRTEATELLEQTSVRITGIETELAQQEAELAVLNTAYEAQANQKAQLEADHAASREQSQALSGQIAELEGLISAAQATLESAVAECQHLEDEAREVETEKQELQAALKSTESLLDELDVTSQIASDTLAQSTSELEQETKRLDDALANKAVKEQELDRLRSRLNVLEREYQEGEGLFAGPRAVMLAVRQGDLSMPGLLGTLNDLIRTPPEYEIAIETALGGHLQDLVVQRWADAELAISYLKEQKAGRATFQPLETVRKPSRRPNLDYRGNGMVGVAADLIDVDRHIVPVVEGLLGRTLIVTDMQAARSILEATRGWTLVTLAGEITRPSGSVTGGVHKRATGTLGRDRERRSLPGQISRFEEDLGRQEIAMRSIRSGLALKREAVHHSRNQEEEAQLELQQVRRQQAERRRQLDEVNRSLDRIARREGELTERQAATALNQKELQSRLAESREQHQRTVVERSRLAGELSRFSSASTDQLTELRIAYAANRERLTAFCREREQAERQVATAAESISVHQDHIAEIEATQESLLVQQAEWEELSDTTRQEIGRLREELVPLNRSRSEIKQSVVLAEERRDQAIQQVRQAEREHDQAALGVARARDERTYLADRISADLDIVNPDELVTKETETSDDQERRIQLLRNRLRRMRAVSEDVIDEYRQESERLEYLTNQLADVEGAAADLARVLGELRRNMNTQFDDTFQEVSREFERTFKRLFAGGVARLSHEYIDGQAIGVEISARPPGKRLQNLSQLSGGERALTAVALLIAIQRVNPSPFCLLDEVDAALDESNVLRFCNELRDLAQTTQYIVITHNRGTIEAADTLYGITMGSDKISRVLSLQLSEALESVGDQEQVDSII